MNGMRNIAARLAIVIVLLAGCSEPQPEPTIDPARLSALNESSLDCLDGDMFACNRLGDMAAVYAPGTNYETIAATCGNTRPERGPDEWCDE